MTAKTRREKPDIRAFDIILEPFIPLGYKHGDSRVRYWPGLLEKDPARYTANNAAIIMMIVAYDAAHQGAPFWEIVHVAIGMPSTWIAGNGLGLLAIKAKNKLTGDQR